MPEVEKRDTSQTTAALLPTQEKMSPKYLAQYGFTPDIVFDVGVQSGTAFLYNSFPDAKFILIDPQKESEAKAERWRNNIDFDFYCLAAGDRAGTVELNMPATRRGTRFNESSVRQRIDGLSQRYVDVEKRIVEIRKLDDIAAKYPGNAGLKIDTEGFELPVLKGATETLKRCEFVIVEFSVTKRFAELEKPSSVISLLREFNLEFRDVIGPQNVSRSASKPRFFDILFTRW